MGLGAPSGHAETNGGTRLTTLPSGGDWITYPFEPLSDSVLELLDGAPQTDGSCLLDIAMALAPSQAILQANERVFNPATCQSVIEFGRPTSTATNTDATADTTAVNDTFSLAGPMPATPDALAGAQLPTASQLTATSAYYTASKGYFKTYYEDPAQVDVNSVSDGIDWTWRTDGKACVSNYTAHISYGWYTVTGWEKKENNWQRIAACDTADSSSYVHYRNGRFCGSVDTHTYYDRNKVTGRKDGYLLGKTSASKKGGCTALLSFHSTLKRTQN